MTRAKPFLLVVLLVAAAVCAMATAKPSTTGTPEETGRSKERWAWQGPRSAARTVGRPSPYWKIERKFVALKAAHGRQGAKLRAARRRLRVERDARRSVVRTLQARSSPPSGGVVEYAIRLASAVTGVSEAEIRSVGSCESELKPWARNGIYRGVMQEGPMFEAGPLGRAGFSVWDPIANVVTAALTVAREGWSQWSCKP